VNLESPEISDLIVSFDPETLERRPVEKRAVLEELERAGNLPAARIAARLPERDGVLDPDAVDGLLIRVHCELQRLWEEFRHGPRLLSILSPLIAALRRADAPRPIRVVDVGCGLGYAVRWLAREGVLGDDIELVGADYNAALVRRAEELAREEKLRCRFVVKNAFRLDQPASVFTSTGVIHHFLGPALAAFFGHQSAEDTAAFLHFDLKPTYVAPLGAWIFHQARMREPLSRHDGLLSAVRSHPGPTLLTAARAGAPGFRSALIDGRTGVLPILRIFHAVIGLRERYRAPFLDAMGPGSGRVGSFS
jgi:SAM-dependent methyltransferase